MLQSAQMFAKSMVNVGFHLPYAGHQSIRPYAREQVEVTKSISSIFIVGLSEVEGPTFALLHQTEVRR